MNIQENLDEYIKTENYNEITKNWRRVNKDGQNILHLVAIYKNSHLTDWLGENFPKEQLKQFYNTNDNYGEKPLDYADTVTWRCIMRQFNN